MQSMGFNLSVRRLVRFLAAVCVCTLLFVSTALPVWAVNSSPTKGEANLTEIEKKSQEAVLSDPYDLEKTQEEANKGINEVQGDADKDKMLRPENTKATSFEQQVKKAVDSMNKDKD